MQGDPVRKRVSELVRALTLYRGLHGIRDLDIDRIRSVERAQAKAMARLRGLVRLDESLSEFVARLLEDGVLVEVAGLIASELGLEAPGEDEAERLIANILAGDLGSKGSEALLLALQSAARSYSEALSEAGFRVSSVSDKCPVCGAASETMVRRGDGHYMVCHFCSFMWKVSGEAIACPKCGATAPLDVGVFSDKARRIGLVKCWRCGFSWRAVLDVNLKAPPIAYPLIALGAERFREALRSASRGH